MPGWCSTGRGYERLARTRCGEVHLAFCVTETFNQRNQGRSIDRSVEEVAGIIAEAHGLPACGATVTLAASFGCPFEGAVDPGRCCRSRNGSSRPALTRSYSPTRSASGYRVRSAASCGAVAGLGVPLGLHLHNTRNTGDVNAFVAVEEGVSVLDASVGIGGCPFAPNATGNIATEDLLYLDSCEGVDPGIDIDQVIRAGRMAGGVLGRSLPGQLHRAGLLRQAVSAVPVAPQEMSASGDPEGTAPGLRLFSQRGRRDLRPARRHARRNGGERVHRCLPRAAADIGVPAEHVRHVVEAAPPPWLGISVLNEDHADLCL